MSAGDNDQDDVDEGQPERTIWKVKLTFTRRGEDVTFDDVVESPTPESALILLRDVAHCGKWDEEYSTLRKVTITYLGDLNLIYSESERQGLGYVPRNFDRTNNCPDDGLNGPVTPRTADHQPAAGTDRAPAGTQPDP
jgi:hypothetical protein